MLVATGVLLLVLAAGDALAGASAPLFGGGADDALRGSGGDEHLVGMGGG